MAEKENRCWPGVRAGQGKEAPQRGKLPSESRIENHGVREEIKFRAKRRKQLDEWQAEHPDSMPQAAHRNVVAGISVGPPALASLDPAAQR
jgi:hypothetical protein